MEQMTVEQWLSLLAILLSIPAIVISIITLVNEKRKIIANTVSEERAKWIADVRELMTLFLQEYIKPEKNPAKLREIKASIDLYINFQAKERDGRIINAMNKCVDFDYNEDNYKNVAQEFQNQINKSWRRLKVEAGITKRKDEKFEKEVNNRPNRRYTSGNGSCQPSSDILGGYINSKKG